MTAFASTTKALWFVWDGAEGAVLGRNDSRVMEVAQRVPECELFVLSTLTETGALGEVLDFFWAKRQRAFMRPLVLQRDTKGIEVAVFTGGRREAVARYHFDPSQDRERMPCDIIFAQVRRDQLEVAPPGFVVSQQAPFIEAEGRLSGLMRNPAHTLVWAVAAPFEEVGGDGILERRVGPLSTLFPRAADLIRVLPVRYRKEDEELAAIQNRVNDSESAITAVARELRHVISLEVDAPLTDLSDPNTVPGVVVFHIMRQRELLQLWSNKEAVLRFTVSDLEDLEGETYPFAPTDRVFAVRPLRVQDELSEGLRVHVRTHHSGNGPVRRFTVIFAFAVLGDLLVVYDTDSHRLAGPDGVGRRNLTFCVGSDHLEARDVDLRHDDDEEMISAAREVVEAGYEMRLHPQVEEPRQALVRFVAAWANQPGLDAEDVERRPLLPLWGITYAAHARYAPTMAQRINFAAFKRDPGVLSCSFLTPALPVVGATNLYGRSLGMASRFFSGRLAGQLGVSDLIMPPSTMDADIQTADRLTTPRNRELWEDAVDIGVRIDIGRTDTDALVRQLKAFRAWRHNADIVDELINTEQDQVSDAFRAYLDEQRPYQRPLDAPEFEQLFTLVQPTATEVERARTAIGGGAAAGPATARDPRTTEQLKADLVKLLREGVVHADPKIRGVAKRHLDANYTLRKLMRDAEKELKALIGSPAISGEILALIDWVEDWAALDGAPTAGAHTSTDRRQRILDLSRALRVRPGLVEGLASSRLGRTMEPAISHVEAECARYRLNAAAEDTEILSNLPHYARLLGFHVAHRALVAARREGGDAPETASRLLSLWPERASECWDRHLTWAAMNGPVAADILKRPWTLPPRPGDAKPQKVPG